MHRRSLEVAETMSRGRADIDFLQEAKWKRESVRQITGMNDRHKLYRTDNEGMRVGYHWRS